MWNHFRTVLGNRSWNNSEPVHSMHWELFHYFKKQVLTLQPLKIACTVCGYVFYMWVCVMEQFHASKPTTQNGSITGTDVPIS